MWRGPLLALLATKLLPPIREQDVAVHVVKTNGRTEGGAALRGRESSSKVQILAPDQTASSDIIQGVFLTAPP